MNKRGKFSGRVLSLQHWTISLGEKIDRFFANASLPLCAFAALVSSYQAAPLPIFMFSPGLQSLNRGSRLQQSLLAPLYLVINVLEWMCRYEHRKNCDNWHW